jgi:hypothetical protein
VDGKIKILFYELKENIELTITVNDQKYQYTLNDSTLIEFEQSSSDIYFLEIKDNEIVQDLTDTIIETNRNLVYYDTKFM